jgi:hypothetical protein
MKTFILALMFATAVASSAVVLAQETSGGGVLDTYSNEILSGKDRLR